MKYSIVATAFFFLGLAASQSTTYPPFDTATTDPYPQHPPSMTDPNAKPSSVAKTTSASEQRETISTTSASSFTVVSETSTGTSQPTTTTKSNDASMAKVGAALIIPGIAGIAAGILI